MDVLVLTDGRRTLDQVCTDLRPERLLKMGSTYCSKCGKPGGEDAKFCEGCGERLAEVAEATPTAPEPAAGSLMGGSLSLTPGISLGQACWAILAGYVLALFLPWLINPLFQSLKANYFTSVADCWDIIWSGHGSRGLFACFLLPPFATAYALQQCLRNARTRPVGRVVKDFGELQKGGLFGVVASVGMYWQFSQVAPVGSGVALFMLVSVGAIFVGSIGERRAKATDTALPRPEHQ